LSLIDAFAFIVVRRHPSVDARSLAASMPGVLSGLARPL
jgi:hypothetical protein